MRLIWLRHFSISHSEINKMKLYSNLQLPLIPRYFKTKTLGNLIDHLSLEGKSLLIKGLP